MTASEHDLTAPNLPLNHPQRVEQRLREEIERLRAEVAELKDACLEARAILGFGDLHPNAEAVPMPELIVACAKEADAAFTECESALAALRKRVEEAPVGEVDCNGWQAYYIHVPAELDGKRVALVALD